MGLDVRLQPWGGTPEAVLFGRPHGDQLPPPRQQGAEFVGLGVRQGPGGRPHRLGKMGQGARIERIRLGQLPGGLGKVTRLAGIDHRHGQPCRRQRRHHGPLVAPRGFEHNQGGLQGLEPLPPGRQSRRHRWPRPSVRPWAAGQYPVGLSRHQYQQNTSWQTSSLLTGPALPDTGLHGSGQLFGLSKEWT